MKEKGSYGSPSHMASLCGSQEMNVGLVPSPICHSAPTCGPQGRMGLGEKRRGESNPVGRIVRAANGQ